MASEVGICNQALQKLGAGRIVSLTEDSVNGRHCNSCYVELRNLAIEKHKWNFARKRTTLAPDATNLGGDDYSYTFTLPNDFLTVVKPNTREVDWSIENGKLLTNDGNTLALKYIAIITDPNVMPPTFREVLACDMANHMCEAITQSSTKKADIRNDRIEALREAKRTNAFQRPPDDSADDSWVTARR